MSRNSGKNIFRKKKTTKKVPPNILKSFELRNKVQLLLWSGKDSIKGKYYVLSSYNQRNNTCIVSPEYIL